MKNVLDELRHRTLWQVVIVYIGASWVLLQAIDLFADNLDLPGWLFPTAGALLLIGLPIILATAFIQRRLAATGEVADETHEKLFTWRNALIGGAGAFLLLFGFAGLYVVVQDRGETFRTDDVMAEAVAPGVAVLPFSVRVPNMDHWREGVGDALYANLEGISGLRLIFPGTVLARWREVAADAIDVDESTQMEVARATGATYAVTGTLLGSANNLRLTAEVVDLRNSRTLGRPAVEGSPDDLIGLVDRFSVEVVRAIGHATEGELGAIDLGQVTTSSPAALRHYLDGTSQRRRGEREQSRVTLAAAVAEDSTFALALYELARAVDGADTINGRIFESVPLLSSARRLTNSPRLDLRIRGLLAEQWGDGDWVPGFDEDSLVATIADLEAAVRRDPSDAESYIQLGEAYWHSAHIYPLADVYDRALEAFERYAELLPQLQVHNGHLYEHYFETRDSLGVQRLLSADRRTAPDSYVRTLESIYRLAFHDLADREQAAVLDSLHTLDRGPRRLWRFLRSPPSYWPILRQTTVPRSNWMCYLGAGLDAGDLRWFEENGPGYAGEQSGCLWLPRLYGLPIRSSGLDSIRFASSTQLNSALLHVDRGDYDMVEPLLEAQRDSIAIARAEPDSARAVWLEARATEVEAYLDWKRDGQPERAVERMASIAQHRDPMLYSEMLVAAGRTGEAARLLQAMFDTWYVTFALYRLAPLYEELGEPDKARAAYAEFIERWKNADPRLQPMVDTARAALARLGPMDQ